MSIFFKTILGSLNSTIIAGGQIPDNKIVVELGQSNMEGRDGDSANPNYPFSSSHSFYWNGSSPIALTTTRGGANGGSQANYFADKYNQLTGNSVIVAEAAEGSTSLTNIRGGNSDWSATGNLRNSAISLINGAINYYSENAPFCALWCQGENDAGDIVNRGQTKANVKTAMQDLVDWWTNLYPNAPFIISLLGYTTNTASDYAYDLVREVQVEIAAENANVFIGFERAKFFRDEGKLIDIVHYSYVGYKEMGESLATKLSDI